MCTHWYTQLFALISKAHNPGWLKDCSYLLFQYNPTRCSLQKWGEQQHIAFRGDNDPTLIQLSLFDIAMFLCDCFTCPFGQLKSIFFLFNFFKYFFSTSPGRRMERHAIFTVFTSKSPCANCRAYVGLCNLQPSRHASLGLAWCWRLTQKCEDRGRGGEEGSSCWGCHTVNKETVCSLVWVFAVKPAITSRGVLNRFSIAFAKINPTLILW